MSVVVVGAGALGNEVAKALGLLGVGNARIVDPDIVEGSNLSRSVLFREADYVGVNKAMALAASAARVFPDTNFVADACDIAGVGTQHLISADLLFSCVDNDLARLEIAYLSTKLQVPVAEGGLGGSHYSHGRVTWFPGRNAACFGCKLPGPRRRELLTFWQATSFSCWNPEEDDVAPSTPTMSAIIGSMQVDLGLRNYFGRTAVSESVELSLDRTPELHVFKNTQAVECPFHEDVEEALIPTAGDITADQMLGGARCALGRDPYIRLDWPVCAQARCQSCGHEWSPMIRLALLRRQGVCPICGSGDILVLRNFKTLRRGDPWAAYPLHSLGMPFGNLVTVRPGGTL